VKEQLFDALALQVDGEKYRTTPSASAYWNEAVSCSRKPMPVATLLFGQTVFVEMFKRADLRKRAADRDPAGFDCRMHWPKDSGIAVNWTQIKLKNKSLRGAKIEARRTYAEALSRLAVGIELRLQRLHEVKP